MSSDVFPRRVVVTGSRGLIGAELVPHLLGRGHEVVRFVRGDVKPLDDGTTAVSWDPEGAVDPRSLEGVDAVVHLAGESIAAGRWTAERKRRILESRTGPTRRLAEAVAALDRKPAFLSASAVGVYGDRGDEELNESSAAGSVFLADLCKQWEAATEPASAAGARVVHARIGIVLTPKGGALGAQLPAFRFGAGAVLGGGQQWVSWITITDLVRAFHHALVTEDLAGPVNLVAPHPVTNREFGRTLARVLRRPFLMTLPAPVLRVLFGEAADEALLTSLRVRPRKLLDTGFAFDHPHLEAALRALLV
ncbi:MAG TPA: TIGR01777 family oxidoreductase [Fimbriiglobus sp.]|nr:TIGR01777 family oxidoreductase [Fimbriiglobus sp.]